MSNRKLWTMRDGTKIRIKDMGDSHLLNTIAMLERVAGRRKAMALCSFPSFNGEMAQFFAEQDWDSLDQTSNEEYAAQIFPIYNDMVDESARRNLPIVRTA